MHDIPLFSPLISANCCVGIVTLTQMPKGIPVATVAIGNAENAGLLAVRILAARDPELWDRYCSVFDSITFAFKLLVLIGASVRSYLDAHLFISIHTCVGVDLS